MILREKGLPLPRTVVTFRLRLSMDEKEKIDFWFAVNNTEVVVRPKRNLESFGTTTIHYHLVTEMMDAVDHLRIREGRIHAYKPEIITPQSFGDSMLEGFGEEQAHDYVDWLRQNQQHLVLMKYGFRIRKEEIHTESVHENVETVLDRITEELRVKDEPLHALVRGVDEPWEVCLLRLMVEMVQQSVASNAKDLHGDPNGVRHEIEAAFREASRNPAKIQSLSSLLQKLGVFEEYEDRFFALVRANPSR